MRHKGHPHPATGAAPPATNPAAMRAKGALLSAVLIANLALHPAAATAARPDPRPISLGKTNVISGDTTGYARVELTREAVLDFGALTYIKGDLPRLFTKSGPSPSVRVSGEGDFIGLAMTRDRAGAPPLFVSGQFRGRSDSDRVVNYSSPLMARRVTLDPGVYRVYLIADGKRAQVSFTFDRGPTGTQRLQPAVRTHAQAATTDEFTEAGGAAGLLHGSNDHTVTTRKTLAVNMLAIHGGDEVLEGAGVCIKDLDATIHLDYYGPRCSGDEKLFIAQASTRADTYFMFLEDHGVTMGRWGFGGWYGGDTAPEYVGLHSLTIDRS